MCIEAGGGPDLASWLVGQGQMLPTRKVEGMTSETEENLGAAEEGHHNHAILTALTMVLGTAQLLERKIARGDDVPGEIILGSLATIREHAWIVERRLQELRHVQQASHPAKTKQAL